MKALFGKSKTLRNQILIVYLFTMLVVLLFVGVMTYIIVLNLITDKAEKQMQQTAIEATGRIESLYQQINNISIQVSTNSSVQHLLLKNVMGEELSFTERQLLMGTINKLQTYSNGISSFELYTQNYKKLIPLDDVGLSSRLQIEWIEKAKQEEGGLVWIGRDPKQPDHFLAIRQVSLMEDSFATGGYLLIQITPNYFELMNAERPIPQGDYMLLLDNYNEPITTNYPGEIEDLTKSKDGIVPIQASDFMIVKQKSKVTGWQLVTLTPVEKLMEGVSVLRTAIVLSGILGFFLFTILSYILSTMITRPIFKLTKAMKQRSEGELTFNTEVSSTVEINELNTTYNQLVEEINHLIQVVYEKELVRSRTELKALQSQINPHFLFNTLNAIYWSLEESGEEELAELIVAMSDLFRYTIDNGNKDEWVTIKEELNHIDKYMLVMKFRLKQFNWMIEVPEEYEHIKIPKLLIQPLVENAIIHGISNKIGDGIVKIKIGKSNSFNGLNVEVADNGQGMDPEKVNRMNNLTNTESAFNTKGKGIGIANVNKRLKLYYENYDLNGIYFKSERNKGTSCSFKIPLIGGMDDAEDHINRGR
ncbi:cache domain-containing sensor histidine kinase [Sutcliffiella halmapala]|uniref:cache domain-containing sensor histidine kinase n=1 Tax=Sutcliffiella halmapala TaxID=79882 RepID=UPI001F31FBB3|nr:sensor histidine kinase [Sutcliffiella halmapala]